MTSIDPHYINLASNNSIAEQIFDRLMYYDVRQRMKPGLAESWRAVDDAIWEFNLRKCVKIHEGSDFIAADVVFSLDRPAMLTSPGGFTIYTCVITGKTMAEKNGDQKLLLRFQQTQLKRMAQPRTFFYLLGSILLTDLLEQVSRHNAAKFKNFSACVTEALSLMSRPSL